MLLMLLRLMIMIMMMMMMARPRVFNEFFNIFWEKMRQRNIESPHDFIHYNLEVTNIFLNNSFINWSGVINYDFFTSFRFKREAEKVHSQHRKQTFNRHHDWLWVFQSSPACQCPAMVQLAAWTACWSVCLPATRNVSWSYLNAWDNNFLKYVPRLVMCCGMACHPIIAVAVLIF